MGKQAINTGASMRSLRKLAGLSLDEVAKRADTSVAYLSKVERDLFVPSKAYVSRVTSAIAEQLKETA